MTHEMTVKEAAAFVGVTRQRMHVFVVTERVKVTRQWDKFTLLDAASVRKLKAELDANPMSHFRRKHK